MKEIEINGIKYQEIEREAPKKTSRRLSSIMIMMTMFEYTNPYGPSMPRIKPLPTNDIVKEFELIQNKQSKLSRSDRERVVTVFNRNFREVKK